MNNISKSNDTTSKSKNRHVETEKRSFIGFVCPKCDKEFGLDATFLEDASELNVHYACPYCHFVGGLEG